MLPELGHLALILAFFVAVVQATVPMMGAARSNPLWMRMGNTAAVAQALLIALSFAALTWCYVSSDFSVLNVVRNSHTDKPLLYKIAGVWANHEGSMLLWVLILNLYGLSVVLFGRKLPSPLRARAIAVQAFISCGFIAFILFTSNPFWRVAPAPTNGEGLNPLLQDPGLAMHPPFLYLGYVGFSMAFSFAIAALIEGRVDAAWARWVRPWTLAAWSFLTFGIGLGAWWAYYTLGWGGWWYWDPVENASFMPWLAGTALLHSSIVVERRETLKVWTIFLTILAFTFSLLGTFLVRSGVLTSVHSFAADPSRGIFILGLLIVLSGGALLLFALRAPYMSGGGLFSPLSREGALVFNNIMLSSAAGAILMGTLYPLFLDVLNAGKISVGPPFFNAVFIPMIMPLILLMPIGTRLSWKRGNIGFAFKNLRPIGLITFAVFVTVGLTTKAWGASIFIGIAVWLLLGTLQDVAARSFAPHSPVLQTVRRAINLPRSFYGMSLAHAGVAILIIGIAASTAGKVESIQVMHVGEHIVVAGTDVTLKNIEKDIAGPNYRALRAKFQAQKGNGPRVTLWPERRLYTMPPRPTTNPAIHSTLLGDLYIVVADEDNQGGYVTRIYYNPLVCWIFIGAGLIALGGVISVTDRRYRSGSLAKG